MTSMPPSPLRAALLVLLTTAGCTRTSEKFCGLNPGDERCPQADAAPDASDLACQLDDECLATPATPVCESRTCVQCAPGRTGACVNPTPVCGADFTCQACTAHSECGEGVCTEGGECVDPGQIAYVETAGTGDACTQAVPCATLKDALRTTRPVVKVTGTIDEGGSLLVEGVALQIYGAPGARVLAGGSTLLEVRGAGASVRLYDLELTGGTDRAKPMLRLIANGGSPSLALTAVRIHGNAAQALYTDGGDLRIRRSHVLLNGNGGLEVTAATRFEITNSVIAYNGDARLGSASYLGGVGLSANTPGSRFEFNTVAFNVAAGTLYRGGISCLGGAVTADGNIIYRNGEADGSGGVTIDATTQRSVGCAYGASYVAAMDAAHLGFVSPLAMPLDFHLTAASPAALIDQVPTCTELDGDGQVRPLGAGCDLGADEQR